MSRSHYVLSSLMCCLVSCSNRKDSSLSYHTLLCHAWLLSLGSLVSSDERWRVDPGVREVGERREKWREEGKLWGCIVEEKNQFSIKKKKSNISPVL